MARYGGRTLSEQPAGRLANNQVSELGSGFSPQPSHEIRDYGPDQYLDCGLMRDPDLQELSYNKYLLFKPLNSKISCYVNINS